MKLTTKGSGWHFESMRHSNARKFGVAGGQYKASRQKNIIMHAGIPEERWNPEMLTKGIKPWIPGEMAGEGSRKGVKDVPALLVQRTPFPLGSEIGDKSKLVKFKVPTNKVYIDWDEPDTAPTAILKRKQYKVRKTYADIPPSTLRKYSMYGSFVKEIKPNQIISVKNAEWNILPGAQNTEEEFLIEGKSLPDYKTRFHEPMYKILRQKNPKVYKHLFKKSKK